MKAHIVRHDGGDNAAPKRQEVRLTHVSSHYLKVLSAVRKLFHHPNKWKILSSDGRRVPQVLLCGGGRVGQETTKNEPFC